MSALLNILAALLVLGGAAFTVIAALGLLRLPDVYSRMHAASKAGTVGSSMALIALAMVADHTGEVLRALGAVFFFLLTAPISAHLLAKASYAVGYPLWSGSVRDEMPPREHLLSAREAVPAALPNSPRDSSGAFTGSEQDPGSGRL